MFKPRLALYEDIVPGAKLAIWDHGEPSSQRSSTCTVTAHPVGVKHISCSVEVYSGHRDDWDLVLWDVPNPYHNCGRDRAKEKLQLYLMGPAPERASFVPRLVLYEDLVPGAEIAIYYKGQQVEHGASIVTALPHGTAYSCAVQVASPSRQQYDLVLWDVPNPYFNRRRDRSKESYQLLLVKPASYTAAQQKPAFVPRLVNYEDLVPGAKITTYYKGAPRDGDALCVVKALPTGVKDEGCTVEVDSPHREYYNLIIWDVPNPYCNSGADRSKENYQLFLVEPAPTSYEEIQPTVLTEETQSMNNYSVSNNQAELLVLARGTDESTMPNFAAAPAAVQAVLKKKLAEAVEKAAEKTADVIMDVINAASNDNVHRSTLVRDYKAMIQREKEAGAERDRAYAYAMATNNWLPLAKMLGMLSISVGQEDKKLLEVPTDWKPAAE